MKSLIYLVLVISTAQASTKNYKNVYGNLLQSCSYDGTALTGYMRDGYCIHQDDDHGSHHICIDLAGTMNDDDGDVNFCTITGQSDWCSSADLPCHDDSSNEACSIGNWCVCQWAFASFLGKMEGGCDQLPAIECASTNLQAVRAYVERSEADAKYASALECLASRCSLDLSNKDLYGSPVSVMDMRIAMILERAIGPLIVLIFVLITAVYIVRTRQCMECAYDACGACYFLDTGDDEGDGKEMFEVEKPEVIERPDPPVPEPQEGSFYRMA